MTSTFSHKVKSRSSLFYKLTSLISIIRVHIIMHVHSYVRKLQLILLANQLNYMHLTMHRQSRFLYISQQLWISTIDKCIIHVLLRVFFFNIKLSTVHVYQMTCFSSITEHRAINFVWVAVSPSLSLSFSRDQKLIEFFFSSRQNGHLEEKFGHAHTFLNIPDMISLLIYWVTSSYNQYSPKRGGRKEGGGWRTLSLTLFSARSFPRVHSWSLEETNQALNEWIYCSIWSGSTIHYYWLEECRQSMDIYYCDLSPSVKGDILCMHLDW